VCVSYAHALLAEDKQEEASLLPHFQDTLQYKIYVYSQHGKAGCDEFKEVVEASLAWRGTQPTTKIHGNIMCMVGWTRLEQRGQRAVARTRKRNPERAMERKRFLFPDYVDVDGQLLCI